MKKHIHKYKRGKLGRKYVIYECVIPGCSHYIDASRIGNKLSICWRCNAAFVIEGRLRELAKPHCRDCTVPKKEITPDIKKFIENLGL
jgi:hypothetical protein